MGDIQEGDAAGLQVGDAVKQAPHLAPFQLGGGLVQDDEARALDQRPGDFHDLPLLDRQTGAFLFDIEFHSPAGQHPFRLTPRRAPADPAKAASGMRR